MSHYRINHILVAHHVSPLSLTYLNAESNMSDREWKKAQVPLLQDTEQNNKLMTSEETVIVNYYK